MSQGPGRPCSRRGACRGGLAFELRPVLRFEIWLELDWMPKRKVQLGQCWWQDLPSRVPVEEIPYL